MNDHVREFRLRGTLGTSAFFGVRLGEVSTEVHWRPRWIEMSLYRRHDVVMGADGQPVQPLQSAGARQWILQTTGRTLVYHQQGSDCATGVPTLADRLPEDAEPCDRCRPPGPAALGEDDMVAMEVDRFMLHVCETPQELLAAMADPKVADGRLSGPAQGLLAQAAQDDPELASATDTVQWLTG